MVHWQEELADGAMLEMGRCQCFEAGTSNGKVGVIRKQAPRRLEITVKSMQMIAYQSEESNPKTLRCNFGPFPTILFWAILQSHYQVLWVGDDRCHNIVGNGDHI